MPSAFVNVNDIFDIDVIQQRIKYAHGVDGTEFWERFFLCDNHCAGQDTVIYLFTYDQLMELYNWWKNNIKRKPKKNRSSFCGLIIDKQKEDSLSDTGNLRNLNIETDEDGFLSGICACFAEFTYTGVGFKRVFFRESIEKNLAEGLIDFFHPNFKESKREVKTDEERRKRTKKLLENGSKRAIQSQFGSLLEINYVIKDKKWLRYLSKGKLVFDGKTFEHNNLEYCIESNQECPMVSRLSSSGAMNGICEN
jgi:hypothetical protein